jgi:uncharacterized protein
VDSFEQLLVIQGHDTHLDQLRHQRDTLPERAAQASRQAELDNIDAKADGLEGERGELTKVLKRREDELAALEAKINELDRTLYGGGVTSPREAVVMQDELASLGKRRGVLEENVLEVMEQIEPLNGQLDELAGQRNAVAEELAVLGAALATAESEIDQQIGDAAGERELAARGVPSDRLGEYEGLRTQLGGIAVARLTGGTCGGCNLTLSAVERDRIKHEPPDAMIHCEECGRILVR